MRLDSSRVSTVLTFSSRCCRLKTQNITPHSIFIYPWWTTCISQERFFLTLRIRFEIYLEHNASQNEWTHLCWSWSTDTAWERQMSENEWLFMSTSGFQIKNLIYIQTCSEICACSFWRSTFNVMFSLCMAYNENKRNASFTLRSQGNWSYNGNTCLHVGLPAGTAAPLCIERIFQTLSL